MPPASHPLKAQTPNKKSLMIRGWRLSRIPLTLNRPELGQRPPQHAHSFTSSFSLFLLPPTASVPEEQASSGALITRGMASNGLPVDAVFSHPREFCSPGAGRRKWTPNTGALEMKRVRRLHSINERSLTCHHDRRRRRLHGVENHQRLGRD